MIGLSRTSKRFSAPDNYRVQILTYSAFGAMFCSLIPFAIFDQNHHELSWTTTLWIICLYSVVGLLVFPRKMSVLRRTQSNIPLANLHLPNQYFITRFSAVFTHDQRTLLRQGKHLQRLSTSIFSSKFRCLCKSDFCSSRLIQIFLTLLSCYSRSFNPQFPSWSQ